MSKSAFLEFKKWEYLLPVAAFLVALALRYQFLITYASPMMIHEQDAVAYMEVAKSILHLQFPSVEGRPPGYPIIIALFALFPIGLEHAARLASIFMDALIVVPLFYISRIFLSRISSFAVCLLWAFFSFCLVFSPSPLSQSSYLCYLLSGIALLHLGLERKNLGSLGGAGMFFALSYLARPEGIVGFACGFLICLTLFLKKGALNKRNLLIPISFLFGFLVLAGPYLTALHAAYGNWTLSPASEAHVKTADAILTLKANGELRKTGSTGLAVWKEHYGTLPVFLDAVWSNIKAFAGVYYKTFPLWMHFLSGAGIVLGLMWRNPWRNFMLLLIPLAVTAPNFVVSIPKTHSYLYPVFALSFICFVSFFDAVKKFGTRAVELYLPAVKPRPLRIFLSSILLLVISNLSWGFYKDAHMNFQAPRHRLEVNITENIYKGAGEIIKQNSQPTDIIMTRWGVVGYFAERSVVILPKGGVKEVIDYGRKNGARFIVIDTNAVSSRRQELLELLGPLEGKAINPAYGIETCYSRFFPDAGGYVIYRYTGRVSTGK